MSGWRAAACLSVLLAALPASASEALRVVAPRQVRIAVVDPFGSERTPREVVDRLSAAFAAAECAIPFRSEMVSARVAAERVRTQGCDAVLIVGPARPGPLRQLAVPTIAAKYGPAYLATPVYLVLANEDAALRQLLAEHFAAVVAPPERRLQVAQASSPPSSL